MGIVMGFIIASTFTQFCMEIIEEMNINNIFKFSIAVIIGFMGFLAPIVIPVYILSL